MPLTDKIVVLTRSDAGNLAWAPHIKNAGFQVYGLATIQTVSLPLSTDTKETLKSLPEFDWIVLTSATSARQLLRLATGTHTMWPHDRPKIAVIGTETGRAAESVGLPVKYMSTKHNAIALGAELPAVRGKRILIPRTTIASDELEKALTNRGAHVVSIPVYETQVIKRSDEVFLDILQSERVKAVVFASPSAVRGFREQLMEAQMTRARQLPVIAIGPGVEGALKKLGYMSIYTCKSPSVSSVIEILQQLDS